MSERRYGYFSCPECHRGWESSWAWCYRNTDTPSSGQKCQNCPDQIVKPYKVERLRCPICHSNEGCSCDRDEHHVDPAKPHRSDLCERCLRGQKCNYRR